MAPYVIEIKKKDIHLVMATTVILKCNSLNTYQPQTNKSTALRFPPFFPKFNLALLDYQFTVKWSEERVVGGRVSPEIYPDVQYSQWVAVGR